MGSQLHPTHAQLQAGAAVRQAEAQSQPVHLQPQIHAHFPVQSNPAQVGLQQIEQNALNQEDPDEDQDEDEALDDGKMHSDVAQFGGPSESVPVHTVLLPLGGCELPLGMPSGGIPGHFIKVVSDSPLQMNMPHRLASLTRFREKRKDRSFYKKVRYAVRKENADRKNRHKGRFVSTKIPEDERTKLQGDASEAHGSLSGSHDSQLQVMCLHQGEGRQGSKD